MKTNQIMLREAGFLQRTSDGYLNANALMDEWNSKTTGAKKLIQNFKAQKETKEFIEELKKQGIEEPYIAKRGRHSDGITWMHPYLFVDFAMWISVEFKFKVIQMITDNLIQFRHEAGDYYKEMSTTIMEKYIEHTGCKPPALLYIKEANMIREISGTKGKERNEMTEKELNLITILQKVNTTLVSSGVGKVSRIKHLTITANSLMC